MAYLAKHGTRRLGGAQVAFVRFLFGLALALLQSHLRGVPLRPVRRDLLFLRGFFGGLAVLLYFETFTALPVGTATLLNYTAPAFTALFAYAFLKETLPPSTLIGLLCAGVGVVMVVIGQGRALGGSYVWQGIALASAVFSGAAVTSIRAARRSDGAWEVFTAFCLFGALWTAPFALRSWQAPTPEEWGILLGVGVCSVGGQMLMTHALGVVSAATSGILAQLTVLIALSLGHLVDRDPVTKLSALGALLTLAGISLAARLRTTGGDN
jgi:drug/metabolite transporter (DMT)-like permease